MEQVKVRYEQVLTFRVVITTTLISVLSVNMLIYFSPVNSGWWQSSQFSVLNLLRFILIDQFLVELITVFMLALLIKIYAERLVPEVVVLTKRGIAKYELRFLLIPLLAFFVFNPFTQTFRFLINYFPNLNWESYHNEYSYSLKLYLTYLPISIFQTYGIINYNLISAISQSKSLQEIESQRSLIEVNTPTGRRMIQPDDIIYCNRKDRKSWVFTEDNAYTIVKSISELERLLGEEFIRINRSTIVKIANIKSYAFWENDKYVVKMSDGPDFGMSRKRLNEIKSKLTC